MAKSIFREKSLDRISSPEQLNDYVKVANPGVWFILSAITVLLVGVCVWGFFGALDTSVKCAAMVNNGNMICFVPEKNVKDISVGQKIVVDGKEYSVKGIENTPVAVSDDFGDYVKSVGKINNNEWVYVVFADTDLNNGTYSAKIVVESISPKKLIFN